jgi:serine/threonine-protein kinase
MALTGKNEIVGTLYYMSPEQLQAQANGQEIDGRSDIFSFGLVLYEMLTGKRAFEGSSPASVIAAIMERPAPSIVDVAPAALDRVLRKCLAKDPDERWQTARDLKDELQWIAGAPASEAVAARGNQRLWKAAAAVLGLAVLASGAFLYRAPRPAPPQPLVRLGLAIPATTPLQRSVGGNMLALSPDGSLLALTLRDPDGHVRLHTRLLRDGEIKPLPGTENAMYPFFSPDGDWIGFFADAKLRKIPAQGGAPVTLCDAPLGTGASWGNNGTIIAAMGNTGVLYRVPAAGGAPVPITMLSAGETTHRWPMLLPGGQAVLFTSAGSTRGFADAGVEIADLKTGARKTLLRGGISPFFVASSDGTGFLFYLNQSTLFAVSFNPNKFELTGTPSPVLEGISNNPRAGGDYVFSREGTLAYLPGAENPDGWPIYWVEPNGKTQLLHATKGVYGTPRLSPDGKRLAFLKNNGKGEDLWVKDLERDSLSRLSFFDANNRWPVWTPDGSGIVFVSSNKNAPGLYWVRADGATAPQRLNGEIEGHPYSFSPDGSRLAFTQQNERGDLDIVTASFSGGASAPTLGKTEPFASTPANEVNPAFSPDGRWLAYESNESGTTEVFVRPFHLQTTGPGGKWQVSRAGGVFPVWSREGHELLFRAPDALIMAAQYTANGNSLNFGEPKVWTETRVRINGTLSPYDLTPDGKRLAALVADDSLNGELPHPEVVFLLNFFDELWRRLK